MSILNWDSYDEPEQTPAKVVDAVVENVAMVAPVQMVPIEVASKASDLEDLARGRLEAMVLLGTDDKPFMGTKRIQAEDKKIVRGNSDVNQLIPFKYDWAWQKYLDGSANHWSPQEINMTADLALWSTPDGLSDDERLMTTRTLGFFSVADTMVANNIIQAVYNNITAPECRQYLLRQAFEEGIHAHSYQYCIESMRMDQASTFNMYREVPSIARKMAWALHYTGKLAELNLTEHSSDEDVGRFIEYLFVYYCIVEGIFFYCGFVQLLALGRRNKLVGVKEQIEYILRDESMHANFGVDVINQIIHENPGAWTPEVRQRILDRAIEGHCLELDYIKDTLPRGVIGVNYTLHEQYLRIIGNRRLLQLGLNEVHEINFDHPYPWMSEMMDLRKEKNFFETRVVEYQVGGGLQW